MLPILEQIMKYSSVPVIVKPNAGLPKQKDGETYYDVSPEEFASVMRHVVDLGAVVIGGMLRNNSCTYCRDGEAV